MFFLKLFSKILKILRSDESPNQVASGFVLGMFLGMAPFWSLFNFFILFLIIIFKINISATILAWLIFSAVIYLVDPWIHSLGYWLLADVEFLKPLWTFFYHTAFVPYTSYNNTVYLGSFVISLLLILPVFWGVKRFVVNYREKYEERVKNWKWVKWIKATKLYSLYERLSFLGD